MSSDAEKTVQRMDEALLDNCRRQGLFKSGDRVIAACSGGADSMALLLFLLRHRRTLEIEVLATHVNHGIRGETARRDADFVADFCRRNGVELFLYDAVQEGIEVPPRPSEDWARGLRYGWFDELAAREEAVIATAHTMSDQAETVLFRMARGTGLHGLTGIPPRRGRYVRPLLAVSHAQAREYLRARGTGWREDATNAEDSCQRNRLRHGVLPLLAAETPELPLRVTHNDTKLNNVLFCCPRRSRCFPTHACCAGCGSRRCARPRSRCSAGRCAACCVRPCRRMRPLSTSGRCRPCSKILPLLPGPICPAA